MELGPLKMVETSWKGGGVRGGRSRGGWDAEACMALAEERIMKVRVILN